jgi:exosortase B
MTSVVTTQKHAGEASPGRLDLALIALGYLAMYAPSYMVLDKTVWNQVGQGHGPVMLALTLWLAWQRWPHLLSLPSKSNPILAALLLAFGLSLYTVGRSQDILMLDVGSQLFVVPAVILLFKGMNGLKLMWFPIFFILFQIPLPGPLVDAVTGPLKAAVSTVAEAILYWLDYPIARAGVTLTIGQYKMLVADACAGLNSIFALEAVGVFYMSLMQYANKWRNLALAVLILPISFVSNVIRVIALVLITYYFGDEVGQGFVHDFSGVTLFVVATVLTIATDKLIGLTIASDRRNQNTEK